MRLSPFLFAVCLGIATGTAGLLGACSDDETSTTSNNSSSTTTTSSQSSGDATSSGATGSTSGGGSGSASGGTGGGGSSSSTSGGTGGGSGEYQDCGSCTDLNAGAPAKECKSQYDKCQGNADCTAIFDCAYLCSTDKDGGCCVKKCFAGKPQTAVDTFRTYDNCVYCTTCKTLCSQPGDSVNATAYCAVFQPGDMSCPP